MTRSDWLALFLLSLLWGGSFFFVEIALTALPPLAVVWVRVATGALVLGAILILTGRGIPQGRAVWLALIGQGVLNNAIPFTLFAVAQGQITGALAAILNATTPLFTLVAVHLFSPDEGITPRRALGLIAGLAGVAVMMWGQALDGTLWAKAACLAAAASYGIAGVWSRRFRALGTPPMQIAFGLCASAAVVILPLLLWLSPPLGLPVPPLKVWAALAGLGLLSTVLAYLLFFRILASAGAVRLALVTFLIPVSATGLGMAFLSQTPEPRHLAGFALIALGLAAVGGGRPVRDASAGSSR